MSRPDNHVRVLYSFPHKLGADRICYTAWQQVNGLASAGADVLLFPGALSRPVSAGVRVQPTLARGKIRIPYRLLGSRCAFALHDAIVARRLRKVARQVDIVHTWPLGALRTLMAAEELGIPTVLERPNAHTRFAYEVVQRECERLGLTLPHTQEHAYNSEVLRADEEECQLARALLCPSDFSEQTYRDKGFEPQRLVRHTYGFDETVYFPERRTRQSEAGLAMLFVGICSVNKGLHFALEAWLRSPAHETGTFRIAGEFLPAYAEMLRPMLSHPSVKLLGHRSDVPELMRQSDILVLPSFTEGFALVTAEALGSGCVQLVSEACAGICTHMKNGLVHPVGDVQALTEHITMLHENRELLERLRAASVDRSRTVTWTAAGARLLQAYREVIEDYRCVCREQAGLRG